MIETRAAAEIRASSGRRLVGYASVFNTPTRIGTFTERVASTAFDESLRTGADVRALVDHTDANLLARTSAGTLALHTDTRGLAFEIEAPDTQLGNDVLTLTRRGDIRSCSFAFRVPAGGESWRGDQRELRNVELVEISILRGLPAYHATSVSARAAAFRAASVDAARLRHLFVRTM